MKYNKPFMLVLAVVLVASMLAACAGATPTAAPAPTNAPAPTTAPAPTQAQAKKFTIGISNPFISSEYRTQMIQELKDVNAEYMKAGVTNDLTARVKAGEIVNHVARQVGGKGGGRADLAQAGGTQPANLPAALSSLADWLGPQLT